MSGPLLFCVNGNKGYEVLRAVRDAFPELDLIVSTEADRGVTDDASAQIRDFAAKRDLQTCRWRDVVTGPQWVRERRVAAILLVGWKYLVPEWLLDALQRRVIVAHDSLLPRYRGFAPLPTALIHGDAEVGVSVFVAEREVDTGDIIFQGRVPVDAGDRISDLIEKLTPLYVEGMIHAVEGLVRGHLEVRPQDHANASYSLWRDEEDYFVDWNESAETLERTIRALGPPYAGARARLGDRVVVLEAAVVEPDLHFDMRQVGKVWRLGEGGEPVVVCGRGMLRLTRIQCEGEQLVPMKRLRVRFS